MDALFTEPRDAKATQRIVWLGKVIQHPIREYREPFELHPCLDNHL